MNLNKLILKEKNRLITEEKELITALNAFFVDMTEALHIKNDNDRSLNSFNYQNINNVLEKFENHHSVHKIRQTFKTDEKFSFKIVTEDAVKKENMNLNGSKITPNGDTFSNILKSPADIHLPHICQKNFNRRRPFS